MDFSSNGSMEFVDNDKPTPNVLTSQLINIGKVGEKKSKISPQKLGLLYFKSHPLL